MNYIVLLVVFFTYSLEAFSQDKGSRFEKFEIDEHTGWNDFKKLDSIEKKIAAEFKNSPNGRSRLTIIDLTDTASKNKFPPYFNTFPQAVYYADTLRVTTGIGFFANMGVRVLIKGDQFEVTYFQDADDTEVFKISENDEKFLSSIQLPALSKKLTFAKPLKYLAGEILTGRFEMTTSPYFENVRGTLVKKQYKIIGIFTCRLSKF